MALEELSEDALIRIMKEPKNALVKQYKKLFEMDGVELEIEDGAIEAIAKRALERKTGARGLRSIFEKTMTDVMYELPSQKDVVRCIVTADTILEHKEPILIRKGEEEAANEGNAS